MPRNFDLNFEFPLPTKLKLAGYASVCALIVVSLVGFLLRLALNFFEAALVKLGVAVSNLLSGYTILSALLLLYIVLFSGFYSVLTRYVQKRFDQMCS